MKKEKFHGFIPSGTVVGSVMCTKPRSHLASDQNPRTTNSVPKVTDHRRG